MRWNLQRKILDNQKTFSFFFSHVEKKERFCNIEGIRMTKKFFPYRADRHKKDWSGSISPNMQKKGEKDLYFKLSCDTLFMKACVFNARWAKQSFIFQTMLCVAFLLGIFILPFKKETKTKMPASKSWNGAFLLSFGC